MKRQLTKIALATAFGLVLVFIFSCSSDNNDSGIDKSLPSVSYNLSSSSKLSSSSSVLLSSSSVLLSSSSVSLSIASSSSFRLVGSFLSSVSNGSLSSVQVSGGGGGSSSSDAELVSSVQKSYGCAFMPDGKCWMTENLDDEGGIYYDNKSTPPFPKAGRLYSWNVAKTVCPGGWHLPSKDEFVALQRAAGGAIHLKSTTLWKKNSGLDTYGFNALPAGQIFPDETKGYSIYEIGRFWTSTPAVSNASLRPPVDNAYNFSFSSAGQDGNAGDGDKSFKLSVRCVKNN